MSMHHHTITNPATVEAETEEDATCEYPVKGSFTLRSRKLQ
jgi:hypothetical protein